MVGCLLTLSVIEHNVLNSPTMNENFSVSTFSSETFFFFTHFGVILLCVYLGMLYLPVEMTISSNTIWLSKQLS